MLLHTINWILVHFFFETILSHPNHYVYKSVVIYNILFYTDVSNLRAIGSQAPRVNEIKCLFKVIAQEER